MASHRRSQLRNLRYRRQRYDSDSDTESVYSVGSDWMKDQQRPRTRRFGRQTQDFAEEGAEIRRNMKSEAGGGSGGGGGSKKRAGLGKAEAKSKDEPPRQCYWVDCVNAARPGSKYCSDKCGEELAKLRITMILPERIKEWQATPCDAEERNKKELEDIQAKRTKFREQFEELDEQRKALDQFIEAVSMISHDSSEHVDETWAGEDASVNVASCVICGHETNVKSYLKHVERCFIRKERHVLFEDKIPSYLPGTRLFCDTLNKKNGLYCKRLAVNCPDHSKRPPPSKVAICGAPLSNDELNLEDICKALKSKCQQHCNWERHRRAEIDIRKVVAWTGQEQMLIKEKLLAHQMSNRGGLLDLLLNSTKTESTN